MCRKLLLVGAGWLCVAVTALAGSPDAIKADEATLKTAGVGTDDGALIDFFRGKTLDDSDREKIATLIRELGADDFAVREKASSELVKIGGKAAVLLRQVMDSRDAEVRRRAVECLRKIEDKNGPAIAAAAARLLAARKPKATAPTLLKFAPFANDASVLQSVRETLVAVAVRDGKPEPVLTGALGSEQPLLRALAGEALVRAGQVNAVPAVRKLLADSDRMVRLRVGLAFVETKKDKSATFGPRKSKKPMKSFGGRFDSVPRLKRHRFAYLALFC